jgi:hypothetical protein
LSGLIDFEVLNVLGKSIGKGLSEIARVPKNSTVSTAYTAIRTAVMFMLRL